MHSSAPHHVWDESKEEERSIPSDSVFSLPSPKKEDDERGEQQLPQQRDADQVLVTQAEHVQCASKGTSKGEKDAAITRGLLWGEGPPAFASIDPALVPRHRPTLLDPTSLSRSYTTNKPTQVRDGEPQLSPLQHQQQAKEPLTATTAVAFLSQRPVHDKTPSLVATPKIQRNGSNSKVDFQQTREKSGRAMKTTTAAVRVRDQRPRQHYRDPTGSMRVVYGGKTASSSASVAAFLSAAEEREHVVAAEDESWGSWVARKLHNGLVMTGLALYETMQAAFRLERFDMKVLEYTNSQYWSNPPTREELAAKRRAHRLRLGLPPQEEAVETEMVLTAGGNVNPLMPRRV